MQTNQDIQDQIKDFDRIGAQTNDFGYQARLGSTGKYYCGKALDIPCSCCNKYCGPTSGCNCSACMRLDIKARLLPKGYLVNKEGFACRQGQTGMYYCGRKVMGNNSQTDGYCGPTNGNNCRSCQIIQEKLTFHVAKKSVQF